MFENNRVRLEMFGDRMRYSRFIASWITASKNAGIGVYFDNLFRDWLRSLGVTENEICDIHKLATCGKMELENNAVDFIQKKSSEYHDYDVSTMSHEDFNKCMHDRKGRLIFK